MSEVSRAKKNKIKTEHFGYQMSFRCYGHADFIHHGKQEVIVITEQKLKSRYSDY